MSCSRRNFLRASFSAGALSALDVPSESLLPLSTFQDLPTAKQQDRSHEVNVEVYYALQSAPSAKTYNAWIESASQKEIWRASYAQDLVYKSNQELWQAEMNLEEIERRLVYLKESRSGRVPLAIRGESAGERKERIRQTEQEMRAIKERLRKENDKRTEALNDLEKTIPGTTTTTMPRTLVPAWIGLEPDSAFNRLNLCLYSLYTSNRGAGNQRPWSKTTVPTDLGALSVTVNYTIPPEIRKCVNQDHGSSTVLYTFLAADEQHATGIKMQRFFKGLSIEGSGEFSVYCQLIDLRDLAERNLWERAASLAGEVWSEFKGLNLADAFGLGVAASLTKIAKQLEVWAGKKKNNNKTIWNRSIEQNNPLIFSNSSREDSYAIRQGLYVLVDDKVDLRGYVLDPVTHHVYRQDGSTQIPLRANHLVFGISATNA